MQDDLLDVFGTVGQGVLETFRTVLLTVGGNQQGLKATHNEKIFRIIHIAHIPGVQPAVTESLGSALRVLPVTGHHILSANDNLSLGAERNLVAVVVTDL